MADQPIIWGSYFDKQPWFTCEEDLDAASELDATVTALETYQNGRIYDMLRYMSIYTNSDLLSMSRSSSDPYLPVMPQQILNTTQALVSTLVSKHVLQETRATFRTEDGDFIQAMKAEDNDKFCWGEAYRLNEYYLAELAFRDALMVGDGWLKWFVQARRVACEHPNPMEMMIDEAACLSGPPQELYQRRYIARALALSLWPDQREQIKRLPSISAPYMWPGTDSDVVRVVEGWHLPMRGTRKSNYDELIGGRHILACGPIVIEASSWDYTCFPFTRFQWDPPTIGGYSIGLVQQLAPLQLELNKMMKRIQSALHLMSVPRIWQPAGCKVSAEYDNLIGNVYKYLGQKPEIDVSPSNAPELYQQADNIRLRMYEMAGVNPMESGLDMPSRVDSRPGLREYQEITSSRHAWVGKLWERCFIENAKQKRLAARSIVEEYGSYIVLGRSKDSLEKVDFKDIDFSDDDCYTIQAESVSLLPSTPAGKRLAIQDLMAAGMFTEPAEAWSMLSGHPDIDEVFGRKTASKKLVEKQVYQIIKKGEYSGAEPDQFQDFIYAKQYATETYQRLCLQKNVPEGRKELLIQYITDCDTLILLSQPLMPMDAGQMMGQLGGQAGAQGGATNDPTSAGANPSSGPAAPSSGAPSAGPL